MTPRIRGKSGAVRLTIVILTRDRWPRLQATVSRLCTGHPGVPIVVVDNGSVDAVGAVEGAELLDAAGDRGAAGRNLGVRRAATELVAFCDDDAWWEPAALARISARFEADPGLGAVTGCVVVEPGGRLDPVSAAHERDGRVTGFLATALAVRRDAFLAVGGFHRQFGIGGEEELLAMQLLSAGWSLAYEPAAVLHHQPAPRHDAARARRPVTGPRNRLWTAWLRRPLPAAARETARVLREDASAKALVTAAAGLPWVLRERSVNPPEVERLYR